ncbi:uncharacterized protein PG986_014521 [Apiospora aurea]|uniref:Uncharacterized protein n=1 Tax=Apiospora aurea TaxID=335848 RepID=A0ABR1PT85_9PEZI
MDAPVSRVLWRLLMASAVTVGEGSKCRHNPSSGVTLSSNSLPYATSLSKSLAPAASSSASVTATDSPTSTDTATDGTSPLSTLTDTNTDDGATGTSTTDSSTMTSMPDSLSSIVSSILDAKSSGILTVTVQTGTSTGTDDGHLTITLPTSTNTGDTISTTAPPADTVSTTAPSGDTVSTTVPPSGTTLGTSDGITESPTAPTSTGTDTSDPTNTAETETTPTTFNTADYTYYEVSLPVEFTTTLDGSATPTTTSYYSITNTPTPSCFIDATNQDQAFKLSIGSSGTLLIPKNGIIGALVNSDFPSQPPAGSDPATTQEDPSGAQANEDYYKNLPTYSFQETADGPKGFYDLVATVSGVTTYVALKRSTMEVRTTTHSTEGQTPDADGLITSIFSFSCDGRMVVSDLSGTVYIWRISADGVSTEMAAGTPDTDTEVLLTPTTMPPGYDPDAGTQQPTLSKRHPRWSAGPRTAVPPNLYADKRYGARDMSSNGCGSGSTAAWIPQLNFGQCCDFHDYCYDNCRTGDNELCHSQYCYPGEWERCNSAFYNCMHQTACPQFSWWGHALRRVLCEEEALFYAWVVTTYKGSDAFRDANNRCDAYCPDTGKPLCYGQCLNYDWDDNNCGNCRIACDTGHHFNCRSGQCVCTADTANDSNNCGGCVNKCPYKTHCSGGQCVCDEDTCGSLCVNKKSHPRNCGTCGNVCKTGYCFQGECVDPNGTPTSGPPQCLPTDAVKNGGFDTVVDAGNAPPWQFSPDTTGTIDYSGQNASISFIKEGEPFAWEEFYFNTGSPVLSQAITVCPGANYELTFTMGAVVFYPGNLVATVMGQAVANIQLLGDPTKGYGPYPFSVPASADTFAYTSVEFQVQAPLWGNTVFVDDVSIYQP